MGTFTAWGFQGEIDAIQWAKSAPNLGGLHGIGGVDAWAPSTLVGSARTIRIQPGTGYCCGVQAELAGTHDTVAGAVASGTRWDTLCVRWTWTGGGTVSTVFVQGTATQAVSGAVVQNPGTQFDQPIALVQWTAGSDTATQIVDLRRWASKRYTATSLLALADLPLGSVVTVGGADYTRVLDGGSLAWSTGAAWTTPAIDGAWTAFLDEDGVTPRVVRYSRRQGVVHCQGHLRKQLTGAPTAGTVFFTLPVGYRPAYGLTFNAGWQGGQPTELLVRRTGEVVLKAIGTGTTFYQVLFHFSFAVDL